MTVSAQELVDLVHMRAAETCAQHRAVKAATSRQRERAQLAMARALPVAVQRLVEQLEEAPHASSAAASIAILTVAEAGVRAVTGRPS